MLKFINKQVKINKPFSLQKIMDIPINGPDNLKVDPIILHKMGFLYNALENGWAIKKHKDLYIFNKNHEGKKEVYLDDYLKRFLKANMDINNLLNEN